MAMSFAQHFIISAVLWLVLTQARVDSWVVGAPAVLAGAAAGTWLSGQRAVAWSLGGYLRFIPVFVYSALAGGIDVAWRAFRPDVPLSPGLIPFPMRLEPGTARVFFMNTVSLLPGTISADARGDTLWVHVLDVNLPNARELRKLEQTVGRLFAISLDQPAGESQ